MTPDVIARVCEPLFTTKRSAGHRPRAVDDLRLRAAVRQVRVYSEVGEETTICIYLPRHHGEIVDDGPSAKVHMLPRGIARCWQARTVQ